MHRLAGGTKVETAFGAGGLPGEACESVAGGRLLLRARFGVRALVGDVDLYNFRVSRSGPRGCALRQATSSLTLQPSISNRARVLRNRIGRSSIPAGLLHSGSP